jgi:hypothetical protein
VDEAHLLEDRAFAGVAGAEEEHLRRVVSTTKPATCGGGRTLTWTAIFAFASLSAFSACRCSWRSRSETSGGAGEEMQPPMGV